MNNIMLFPALLLSTARKTAKWRKQCVDFVDAKLHFDYNFIRSSIRRKKVNYDLLNGKIHMDDLQLLINPEGLKAGFIPDKILHYSIINPKLQVLRGEESKRIFDYRVIVTNPNAISEVENNKRDALMQSLQLAIEDESISEEEFNAKVEKLNDYFTYEWQDIRELRANCLLNHYVKEYNMPLLFNTGFVDAMTVAEEIYLCDIVGGEPVIEKINPLKIKIFRSGYSNKVEDADIIVLLDYWSPGRIYDVYGDVLTKKDLEYIEKTPDNFSQGAVDSMDNIDETMGFVNTHMISDIMPGEISDSTVFFDPLGEYSDSITNDLVPYDINGNIRVIRVYWKSRKKIKKIKFYDPETGEEDFTFMPEDYVVNESRGEEETAFWVNEAWEGTKIGLEVYVNIRPRPVLYNRLSNPGRCHFGIVGSIYNLNDDKPFSMVDMMKPYSYLYDVIHDRLNKMMARNWGKMTRLDLAKKPKSWKMDKWLYYAKTMGLFVEDSFNEGSGTFAGKAAGGFNNNTQGVIDADFGNNIQQYINLLDFIKMEMADVAGISKQREGLISNRETVGGVERATLQSSHITEWLFSIHDDVKKRAMEVFLETAKAALKGRNKKFLYILPDAALRVVDIDGDEFAECDYGLVVDNSNSLLDLNLKLETLAQAALLTLTLSFSTIMKLFMSCSLAEKQRFVENDEKRIREEAQQLQQQLMQQQEQQIQANLLNLQAERELKDNLNQRDNETRIMVAEINSQAELAVLLLKNNMTESDMMDKEMTLENEKAKLMQEMELMDKKFLLERDKMNLLNKLFDQNMKFLREKLKTDAELKKMAIKKKTTSK